MTTLKVGLLGCGVVGLEVARELLTHRDELSARAGTSLELCGVAVRRLGKSRDGIPDALLTDNAEQLVDASDVVIEVIGGIEPARTLMHRAFSQGVSVVTANKALIAEHGAELFDAARDAEVTLSYEAAVAGAIPLIRPVQSSLSGDRIVRIMGIVNGTTNYVLDQMHTTGASFDAAVRTAQSLGYAEADPTADVEGFDAAAKAAILSTLAFHYPVTTSDVYREGITGITAGDINAARNAETVIKLLAVCERTGDDDHPTLSTRVHPALVPQSHPLASVRGAMNAVFVEAEGAGPLMFYGAGAGGVPTASAVLGDLVSACRLKDQSAWVPAGPLATRRATIADFKDALTKYHVRLSVADTPGVLSRIAEAFARHGVSIETVHQRAVVPESRHAGAAGEAILMVMTHTAREADLAATLDDLRSLDMVFDVTSTLRVAGE